MPTNRPPFRNGAIYGSHVFIVRATGHVKPLPQTLTDRRRIFREVVFLLRTFTLHLLLNYGETVALHQLTCFAKTHPSRLIMHAPSQ